MNPKNWVSSVMLYTENNTALARRVARNVEHSRPVKCGGLKLWSTGDIIIHFSRSLHARHVCSVCVLLI